MKNEPVRLSGQMDDCDMNFFRKMCLPEPDLYAPYEPTHTQRTDITYCVNPSCPFSDCFRHYSHAPRGTMVSMAQFGGVCRSYIHHLLEEIEHG